MASATADNRSDEVFNADTYQLPTLQFDSLQEKVIVNEAFGPETEEAKTQNALKGATLTGPSVSILPKGSIIYYALDDTTTVFDQTGKQMFSSDNKKARMVPTPMGLLPSTHVKTIPSGSLVFHSANATYVVNNNDIIYIEVHEKPWVNEMNSGVSSSGESSVFSSGNPESLSMGTDLLTPTVIESAKVDNPSFSLGNDYTARWIVPDPPRQSGSFSPTYLSIGLNNIHSDPLTPETENFKSVIGYDYEQNSWSMTVCNYYRYAWGTSWYSSCSGNILVHTGDLIEGRIEYNEDTGYSPPIHAFSVRITDITTGQGTMEGVGFPRGTDAITQLNINLQGDLANLNENTITGDTTFSPVNLPVSPTTYVNPTNTRLSHLNVENLWPDKIIFHTLNNTGAEGYTFSMTNVMDPPGTADKDRSGFITTQNVSHWLGDKAGWKLLFNKSWENVTKADFGSDGGGLNNATLHWHVGHGGTFEDGSSFLSLQDYPDSYLPISVVEKKWGGKNKWVVLVSCEVLSDESWGNALSTSHGIFGFKTASYNNPALPAAFFHHAMEEKKTLYDSWYQATTEVLGKEKVWTKYISVNGTTQPDKKNGVKVPVSAGVMFKTAEQMNNDHLPGYGTVELDGDPNNSHSIPMFWNCSKNEV